MEFAWSKEPKSFEIGADRIIMETCKGTNLFNSMTEERRDHRQGDNFALHYSEDGEHWKMARMFRLNLPRNVKVGISAPA